MKVVVFHDVGDVRLDDVDEPRIQQPTGAIDAYKEFDRRQPGWIEVDLQPATAG